ncbi:hypothetical protein [Chryseobacterium sp. POE27]|uniref:hypothetical protein n=1 Tax=Chryseobacterium sp. POE27 TaxID=3138177 RepID=UPI003219C0F8
MKKIAICFIILVANNLFSQKMKIINKDKQTIKVSVVDSAEISHLIKTFQGKKNISKHKNLTSKTYVLDDRRIIIEFFDRQGVLVNNDDDFNKLKDIQFVKNQIWNLKKNISYKNKLDYVQGLNILKTEKPQKLQQFNSIYGNSDFGVYKLKTDQILFLSDKATEKYAGIYPDLKTLASDNYIIEEEYYSSNDEENIMRELAGGNPLEDYEPNEHLIYPKYVDALIKNHKLKLLEEKVYIKTFYGNLYKSEKNGFYFLIDEINQKNGAGDKMQILEVNIFSSLGQVREAQKQYENFRNEPDVSEYFYQKISDRYGKDFPKYIPELIDQLSQVLNIEKEELTFDRKGLEIVDEAIIWNKDNVEIFNNWFPSVIAFYGQYYIENKKEGKWITVWDEESHLWIPQLQLNNGSFAWNAGKFYKDFYEGSIRLQWIEEMNRK